MKKLASITAIAAATVLTGCAGQLYIHTDKSTACVIVDGECTKYKGVPFHPLKQITQHYLYDRILDAKGNISHHYGKNKPEERCEPYVRTESSIVPDLESTHIAQWEAGAFETVSFSVGLTEKGTLSSVGATSTPGGKALVETVIATATTARSFSHGHVKSARGVDQPPKQKFNPSTPLCNAGKVPVTAEFVVELTSALDLVTITENYPTKSTNSQ